MQEVKKCVQIIGKIPLMKIFLMKIVSNSGYSGDPKSNHSKSGFIQNPDVFDIWFSNGAMTKMSGFQLVLTKWQPFCKNHSKFDHHLKTGHVRFSDPHCIFVQKTARNFDTILIFYWPKWSDKSRDVTKLLKVDI